ncbi:transglycosylase SLT domain-containing protein [Litoreibacter roseus]|uniref:Lytic transglycosylase n=1 Tax=Litoreibacter roseus TaxID=2601869 RepID=A0A6N6JC51_9RHOB|nr:transglycosylase SLT domain-containing protein [Litoreibacter roseus]GFE63577.1 lytic transglycosylase [Litoreibacter roseus]
MVRQFLTLLALLVTISMASAETESPLWGGRPEASVWSKATRDALSSHGKGLLETVPQDIRTWCPAYPRNDKAERAAFWTGFLSALAKHESTWRPAAVGGGGRWFGLVQIQPSTARAYGCAARTGSALKDGTANLSCAIRIMAKTVQRDQAIARRAGARAGVGADWGPLVQPRKRAQMIAAVKSQPYCEDIRSVVPAIRPEEAG